jgi:hypothetical protein
MQADLIQPWVTVGGTGATSCVQEEERWFDVGGACDANFYLDCLAVNGTLTFQMESSPTHDESLFTAANPCILPVALSVTSGPLVCKTIPGAVSVSPLARYVRWRISSSASGAWSTTFRVRMARSRTPFFSPTMVPGCALWLRADLGVASGVATWLDQSANRASFSKSGTPTLTASAINGLPAVNTTMGFLETAGVTVAQPDTLIVVCQSSTADPGNYMVLSSGTSNADNQQLAQTLSVMNEVNLNAGTGANVTLNSTITSPTILQVDWVSSSAQVYQNGSAAGSGVTVNSNSNTIGYVGAQWSSDFPFSGTIAEVLLFAPALTSRWRTLVNRYLGARYAISVP